MKIVDAHNSVVPWDESAFEQLYGPKMVEVFRPCSYDNIVAQMDRLGIERLITWNVAARPELSSLCNDWTARVRDRNPERFIGFCSIHPAVLDEAIWEIERAISELGLVGLKIHSLVQGISMSDPNVTTLINNAKERNIPVVLHVNPPTFEEFQPLEKESNLSGEVAFTRDNFLDTMRSDLCDPVHLDTVVGTYDSPKVMSAHMGGVFSKRIWDSKISFHTAGASKDIIEWTCRHLGADRVIFGTDLPFFKMDEELDKVMKADISPKDREKVLSGNILRILER